MTKPRKAAYVVFRGRRPGIYHNWEACEAQVDGFSKAVQHGFDTIAAAEAAWADWQRKVALKLANSAPAPAPAAKDTKTPWAQSLPIWQEPSTYPQSTGSVAFNDAVWNPSNPYPSSPIFYYDPPLPQIPPPSSSCSDVGPPFTPYKSIVIKAPSIATNMLDYTRPQLTETQHTPNLKRCSTFIDLTEDASEEPDVKRFKPEELTMEEKYELLDLKVARAPVVEAKVQLSDEQQRVVNLAMSKNNIFLTGAAGSGKTVTLKEIMRRLSMKKKGGKYQVIAPTGIAALPLNGRTTYSFGGWHLDSFRDGVTELLKKRKKSTIKAIEDLDVLIIEEISMVENQFLERLNLLFRSVMGNTLPFGGKQVILLGDFHQLPPVKPFDRCMLCGEAIPPFSKEPNCMSKTCKFDEEREVYTWGSKWAFRAKVWKELNLRHIKLEQIHRQKDFQFQDVLNKIRDGIALNDEEWDHLERPKTLPPRAYAIRLMSRLAQVKAFNEQQLHNLRCQPKIWKAKDSCIKLWQPKDGPHDIAIPHRIREYTESLKDHRFVDDLTLKVGAQVVLLHNLMPGLVNGSQGVVIGFQPAKLEMEKIREQSADHQSFRYESMKEYRNINGEMRPLVRFANGQVEAIPAIASASLRGGAQVIEQYVVCRTQVPVTLAWALSIHKSQGMTLDYVEVSSRDIFESGQLYVALSRATKLDWLRLTGFNRVQLPMDKDVLEFYSTTKWEELQRKPRKRKSKN